MPLLTPAGEEHDWACMTILGQVFRTYIVGTDGDHLYFVDQHVAHERILFERELARLKSESPAVQPLLIPRVMSLPAGTRERIEDQRAVLEAHGFRLGFDDDGSLEIRALPLISERVDPVALVEDLIQELDDMGVSTQMDRIHRRIAATIACRSAYMSGDEIEGPQLVRLVTDLATMEQPMTCPHGRPSVLVVGRTQLDHRFLRP